MVKASLVLANIFVRTMKQSICRLWWVQNLKIPLEEAARMDRRINDDIKSLIGQLFVINLLYHSQL